MQALPDESRLHPFVPILTVLPEAGGRFIWFLMCPKQGGVGPCLCASYLGCHESYLLSEGLYLKFCDWHLALESALRDAGYWPDDLENWDWNAFHQRGMELCRWLKEEVGDTHRVVYHKAGEDPDRHINERTEIFADRPGMALPPMRAR